MKIAPVEQADATSLLAELLARGLRLKPLSDGRIYVQPAALVDNRTAARIRAMRGPLLEALGRHSWPCVRCTRFRFSRPTVVCYWCRRLEGRPAHA